MTAAATDKTSVLVTGAAGFIGFHFTRKLLGEGCRVIGVDSINDYYDTTLKYNRLNELGISPGAVEAASGKPVAPENRSSQLVFYKTDLKDRDATAAIFATEKPDYVVHLAAQAGVRYSLENPFAYVDSNILGFMNILENCRHHPVTHLVYASSSSVYGANREMPFSEDHNVDNPVSLYAATKKSNELMAHSYAHLFAIPVTGLRFFTVYGPWGRPDMAYFSFTKNIMNNTPIDVFNHGDMKRDFTYIDDIVEGLSRVMNKVPPASPTPYRLFNMGNNQPVNLLYFIQLLEKNLGKEAVKRMLPMQPGDVKETYADIDALHAWTGFKPSTSIEEGIARFIQWYRPYVEDHGEIKSKK